ncbi:hypothetical protein [Microcoleus sp. herbarium12]|jgi:hypothetical protein|uniref:hypothetical protein n=1 Tax=Microcoleus sp. herbarium12 TaxID=3055437 RepID=UPI002FD29E83
MSEPSEQKANVLILTATITPPPGARQLSRTDPNIRLNDYRKAFEFYLSCLANGTISGLIFADNSASDISTLHELARQYDALNKIEFISFEGLDYSPAYGRGYGEFKMLDYVMQHSRLIHDLPAQANIWKVTGRYILRNLADVIKTAPPYSDFYCNCRNIPIYWIDLYILCWNKDFYQHSINGIYESIKEDYIAGSSEVNFRKIIDEKKGSKYKIFKRFRTIPQLEGYRGSDNQIYEEKKVKLLIRTLANKLIPWIWI